MRKILLSLVGFRFALLFFRAFLPLTLPEIWRQVDTLGVTLRYWIRWTHEGDFSLLPAILNSGDARGIMPMEFPILNILAAPTFVFGPRYGMATAQIFLFAMILSLVWANARAWRDVKIAGVPADLASWMLPVFSFGAVWGGKFMPDFLAMLLTLLSVAASWRKDRRWTSGVLATVGLLMKPTSVVVLFLWVLHEGRGAKLKRVAPGMIAALVLAFLYYTAGVAYLGHFVVGEARFAVQSRPFVQSILEFFRDPETGTLFSKHLFFPGGILLVGLGYFGARALPWKLFLVAAAQLLTVAGLSGAHGLTHVYYYTGLTPTLSLIYLYLYFVFENKWVRGLLLLALTIHLLDRCNMETHTLYSKNATGVPPLAQCESLIRRHPEFPWRQGRVFRSPDGSYPDLGLCFGERENSKVADYGFWWKKFDVPVGCRAVDQSPDIILIACGQSAPVP